MRCLALFVVCLAVAVAVAVAGCGASADSPESVVRAWSEALNAGDNDAAAALFARGAQIVQGGRTVRLDTRAAAVAWNSSLPCSGEIVELETEGDTVTATFVLGNRTTSPCDAPGAQATAAFHVEDGKIVLWHQLEAAPQATGPAV